MSRFETQYKKTLSKVKLPEKDFEEVKVKILSSKEKRFFFKVRYAILAIILLVLLSACTIYHEKIEKIFQGYVFGTEKGETTNPNTGEPLEYEFFRAYFRDTFDIPENLPFTENDKGKEYYYSELENILGVEILKSPFLDKDYFKLNGIKFNDGKISSMGFLMGEEAPSGNEEKISLRFSFNTQYSREEEREKTVYAISGCYTFSEYHIESLDTDAFIIEHSCGTRPEWTKVLITEVQANFSYKGIAYKVVLNKKDYKVEDFHDILDSFAYELE